MKYFFYILLILPLPQAVNCCLGSSLVRKLGDASKESGSTLKWPSFEKDSRSPCDKVELVTREEWNAKAPKSTSAISSAVDYVFIHHTAEKKCFSVKWCTQVLQDIQNYHMTDPERMYQDIAYSFLVGEDGRIYEGRGWNRVGAHSYGYNSKSYGISFMGNYMKTAPNKEALKATKNLIACGQEKGKISASYRLYGHRDIKATACPGDMLYSEIQTWPTYGDEFRKTGDAADENGNIDDSSDGTGQTEGSSDGTGQTEGSDSKSPCDKFELVTREEWKAEAPKSTSPISSAVNYVFIHHTAGMQCDSVQLCTQVLQSTQAFHKTDPSTNYADIAYSFLVGEDGRIYEGRGWNVEGAHSKGYNSISYGISFIGNYNEALPEEVALNAAKNLITCGQEKGKILASYRLYGHRDISNTVCPGNMLYNEIQKWPTYGDEFRKTGDSVDQIGNTVGSSDENGQTESSAPDQACIDVSGECQITTNHCEGSYISGKCSGPSDRKCCIESESESESKCLLTDQQRNNIQKQIEIDEGRRDEIYNDSRGYFTFGIGHRITEEDPEHGQPLGTPISPERVTSAFQADLDEAIGDLDKWLSQCGDSCDNYPGEVKEILVNMLFNLGLTRLNKFDKFKTAICAKDWNTAADEMVDSDWYGQVKDRSKRLVERMRKVGDST